MSKSTAKDQGSKLVLSIFEGSRRPKSKKALPRKLPYIHKKKPHEKLISIQPTATTVEPQKLSFKKLDDILRSSKGPPSLKEAPTSSLPLQILKGDMDSINIEAISQKYQSQKFPLPDSKQKLKDRVSSLLPIIPKLLEGNELLSYHYTLASEQRKKLKNATMSSNERWDVRWDDYMGGFYGFRRQAFILALVQKEHADLLSKTKNKTMTYWSTDMFCTYVLANEIILRLIMEDMKLQKSEAERVMKDSIDYGCHIADSQDFADDLKFEEFQVM